MSCHISCPITAFDHFTNSLPRLAHGTFIGSTRLEGNKPQQVFADNEIKFGASTRTYVIRERPQQTQTNSLLISSLINNASNGGGGGGSNQQSNDNLDDTDNATSNNNSDLNLPQTEADLDVTKKV